MRTSWVYLCLLPSGIFALTGCIEDTPIGMITASTSQGAASDTTGGDTVPTEASMTGISATGSLTTGSQTTGPLTAGSSATDTSATDPSTTDPSATDPSTTGTGAFGSCDDADPELDAAYLVSFGLWEDPQILELDDELHDVTISDICTISSVTVDLGDVITGLECTQGDVDIRVVAPRSGDVAWSPGESVSFDFRDAVEDISVSIKVEKYVAVRRDERPLFVGVSADDDHFGELFDPVSVTYDGALCGGDVVAEDAGVLTFEAPGGGETSIYDRNRGSVDVDGDLILDIDVGEAHRGPCCHVSDTFDYLARAALRP